MKKKIFTFMSAALMISAANAQLSDSRGKEITHPHTGGVEVTIDGEANEQFWGAQEFLEIDTAHTNEPNNTKVVKPDGPDDATILFKTAYDENYFYVFVSATDDAIVAGNNHLSDNIELFFNFDSSFHARDAYNDLYASQVRFNVGTDSAQYFAAAGFAVSAGDTSVYKVKYVTKITANGWDLEGKLPWSALFNNEVVPTPFTVEDGAFFTWEIEFGDGDDPERSPIREHILMWNGDGNDAWKNVDNFAFAWLGDSYEYVGIQRQMLNTKVNLYPSVVSSVLNVNLADASQVTSINVMNLTGQSVLRVAEVKSENRLSMNNLPAGLYIVSVNGVNNAVQTHKIIKK